MRNTRDCFERQRGLIVIIILLTVVMVLEPSLRDAQDACIIFLKIIGHGKEAL